MKTTIQIMNRSALIGMLKHKRTSSFTSKQSRTESTFFEYNGIQILRITTTNGKNPPIEMWMVEDTSYTWDELAEVIKRNSIQV